MNILIATEVINVGGAETFTLRLSSALQKKGHNVFIYSFYKDQFEEGLYKSLAPNVQILWPEVPMQYMAKNIDRVLFKSKIDYKLQDTYFRKTLEKFLSEKKIDIVHSHLLKTDTICLEAGRKFNIPVVTTIHGDYLQFYNKTQQGIKIPLLNYKKKAAENLNSLKKIVCISDKQVAFFHEKFFTETKDKVVTIYNGYSTPKPAVEKQSLRESLKIKTSDFVFGMVSRGVPTKGWEEAIAAFLQLNNESTHLVFIGDSEYVQQLKTQHAAHKRIHFIGFSSEPLEWINIFDIGLLPSTYPSESLPTVIVEYLRCNKPIIASDAGEIKKMIQKDGKDAGIIVPVKDGKIPVPGISEAMKTYIEDKNLYALHQQNTSVCFEQFDMNKCVAAYTEVYKNAIVNSHKVKTTVK